jgi:DNA adenine methylase
MKSFIRWAGSKRQIVNKLRRYWPGGSARYVEPFAGSACLFFELEPTRALLGDLNWELIAMLRAVKRDVNAVLNALLKLPKGKDAYYKLRRIDPKGLASVQIAARFLYLNRYCFNGLYRTNGAGQFNVPYGPPKKETPLDVDSIIRASRLLQNAQLVHADFEETVGRARRGDFVYLDPPYLVSSRRLFSEYFPDAFGGKDLKRLASVLSQLHSQGVGFVVTYADCREARRLLARWRPRRISVRRSIAGFAADRRASYELLATNLQVRGARDAD